MRRNGGLFRGPPFPFSLPAIAVLRCIAIGRTTVRRNTNLHPASTNQPTLTFGVAGVKAATGAMRTRRTGPGARIRAALRKLVRSIRRKALQFFWQGLFRACKGHTRPENRHHCKRNCRNQLHNKPLRSPAFRVDLRDPHQGCRTRRNALHAKYRESCTHVH